MRKIHSSPSEFLKITAEFLKIFKAMEKHATDDEDSEEDEEESSNDESSDEDGYLKKKNLKH